MLPGLDTVIPAPFRSADSSSPLLPFRARPFDFSDDLRKATSGPRPEHGSPQSFGGVHCYSDIAVAAIQETVSLPGQQGVEHRVRLYSFGQCLDDEGLNGEFDSLFFLFIQFLPPAFQIGDVCAVEIADMRDSLHVS